MVVWALFAVVLIAAWYLQKHSFARTVVLRNGSVSDSQRRGGGLKADSTTEPVDTRHWTPSRYLQLGGIVAVNLIVVVGLNAAYIYVYFNESTTAVFLMQVLVALCKVVWNTLAVPRALLLWFRPLVDINSQRPSDIADAKPAAHAPHIRASLITIEVFIVLMNNLVLTFVTAAFLSSNCFYHVVSSPANVVTTYNNQECELRYIDSVTHEYVCSNPYLSVQETSYTPPFAYSYQCASTVIA
eukprot:gene35143-43324_t